MSKAEGALACSLHQAELDWATVRRVLARPGVQVLATGLVYGPMSVAGQHGVAHGTCVAPSKQTMGEYLEQWLPTARARLRPGAYDACVLHVRAYLVPHIGDVPLQALTSSRVKALYQELETRGRARGDGGLSPKTVHNIHRTLSRALTDAVGDRLLERNPAQGAHHQLPSRDMPTWTAEQLRTFLDFVAEDRFAALWRLAATTGLRRGELAGLRWRDVDVERGRITVLQRNG